LQKKEFSAKCDRNQSLTRLFVRTAGNGSPIRADAESFTPETFPSGNAQNSVLKVQAPTGTMYSKQATNTSPASQDVAYIPMAEARGITPLSDKSQAAAAPAPKRRR
jgi:hypothetical protein